MIREMTVDDIDYLVDMGERMHIESDYSRFEFSKSKCRILGHEIIASPTMCGFVSEVDNIVIGMFLGVYWSHHFLDSTVSADLLLYVDEKYRGGLTGYRLVSKYIKWAKENNVDDILLGETANIDPASIDRLYKKLGFVSRGTLYKLNGEI